MWAVAKSVNFALGAALCACATHALASERGASQQDATVVAAADMRPAIEASAATLPRFDGADGVTRASRFDVTVFPDSSAPFGFTMGMSNVAGFSGTTLAPGLTAPSLHYGLRWRYTLDSSYRFDIMAYRRVSNSDAISLIESQEPNYGARVEVGMGKENLRRGFVADRGFVGFQLEGGGRLGVKRKFGGPMVYYRNEF